MHLCRLISVIGPLEGTQTVGLTTDDPKGRLAALQMGCPQDLVMHLAVRPSVGLLVRSSAERTGC